ncbi:MAG: hypothetical protein J0L84_02715 [Verrucomicrobia bacterium]|nr:hypothetical protein [Verrucomicrobiota bacterium]
MNKVLSRLQALRDKAARIQQAVDSAPVRAAQLLDAVQATTGQLQQLRADVQGTVASLKADTDSSLAETLIELDGGIGLFARAGYELAGVDIEQGPVSRVIVHLDQCVEARSESLESLMQECSGKRTLQAIFGALIRAEAMEDQVTLSDLGFRGLIVHIGPVPTVRLCWRPMTTESEEEVRSLALKLAPALKSAPAPPPEAPPVLGASSGFFPERRPVPVAPSPPATVLQPPPAASAPVSPAPDPQQVSLAPTRLPSSIRTTTAASPPASSEIAPATGDWRKDALARFKKMPDLGR